MVFIEAGRGNDELQTVIRKRSGRHSQNIEVTLPKDPRGYVQGEQFTITVEGREISVHVEIPIDEHFKTLCVA